MVKLGQRVQDKITGFGGIVTGRVEYLTGCNQLLVAPLVKEDGGFRDSQWFDEQRLVILDATPLEIDNGTTPGCDQTAPRR